jgi:cytochrome c biogenesis protein
MADRPGAPARLRASLALAWRTLRSMRTALILLLVLALAAVAGSLVPQEGFPGAAAEIARLHRDHPFRAELFQRLGLFDVYGSWWFTLIYTLLLISLAACLFPRTRALLRNLLARPVLVREVDGFRHYAERPLAGEPDAALSRARRVLRRRRFRVRGPEDATIAAEKGLLREIGSLAFHWSFFLLLIGVIYGRGTGFTGTAVIAEGETWAEIHAGYDGSAREGRFFNEDHSGLLVHVRDFQVRYRPDLTPEEFTTRADLARPDGTLLGPVDIRVNHPANALGVKLYQAGYGWAPVVRVEREGEPIADAPLITLQPPAGEGEDPRTLPWRGILRLPSLRPQVAIVFELYPDGLAALASLQGGEPLPMVENRNPFLTFDAYRGDLPETAAFTLDSLDTSGLQEFASGLVGEGGTEDLGDGVTLGFPELREYTVLQVSRDRGLWIMLAAGILILLGLLPALYDSRRRLWVRAERSGEGTVLKVGGFALQRRDQFEEEFARVVDELAGVDR